MFDFSNLENKVGGTDCFDMVQLLCQSALVFLFVYALTWHFYLRLVIKQRRSDLGHFSNDELFIIGKRTKG